MPRVVNLTGQVFSRLTVIELVGRDGGHKLWNCTCTCGRSVITRGRNLTTGHTKSCGCLLRRDLSRQRFGRYVALEAQYSGKRGSNTKWLCVCDCGNQKWVNQSSLLQGRSRSCGCLSRELSTTHGNSSSKEYGAFHTAKYKRRKDQSTPLWADLGEIQNIYASCPEGYHVDHIIPLNGALVSGLHVPANLQYLPKKENLRKSNKFTPYTELSSPMAV